MRPREQAAHPGAQTRITLAHRRQRRTCTLDKDFTQVSAAALGDAEQPRLAPGCGLTHLLQAACHQAQEMGMSVQYLPLRDLVGYAPEELFIGLEELDLICLDCLPTIAGRADWELAIFNLYNRLRERGRRLLVAAEHNPRELAIALEDLRSRLQWGITYQVHNLSDDEKQQALQLRARARGLELNDEVAQYIIQRLPRDTNELFWQLQRLDQASLAEQRKLTIPFVKKVLAI